MKYCIIDTEGDDLAYTCTKLHVLSYTYDCEEFHSTPDYDEMREILTREDHMYVCHNAIQHDMVVFKRILGLQMGYKQFWDSIAVSQDFFPKRPKHGLAYLGELHGVPKPKVDDWKNLSYEEYRVRCEEDVKINYLEWLVQVKRLKELYG